MRLRLFVAGAIAIIIAALGYSISRAPCFQLVGEITCRVETDRKLVALTFDDGPTSEGLDSILPVLERHGVRATFFLVGEEMERRPGEAERLVRAGHELGNHTYTHRRMLLRWPSTYGEEIVRTDALLRGAGQRAPSLLRPPYGKRLIGFPLAAEKAGYRMITWDVEEDYGATTARLYATRITDKVRPGSIVLMHPMYGNHALVRDALPIIIDDLQRRGFRLVTVSELLKAQDAA